MTWSPVNYGCFAQSTLELSSSDRYDSGNGSTASIPMDETIESLTTFMTSGQG